MNTTGIRKSFEASEATAKEGKATRAATATDLLIELVRSRYPHASSVSAELPWYLDGGANEDDEWRVCNIFLSDYKQIEREYDGGLSFGDHDGPDEFGDFTEDDILLMDRLAKKGRKDPRWRHSDGWHDELSSMALTLPQAADGGGAERP